MRGLKCPNCGGSLKLKEGANLYVCEYCGYTEEKSKKSERRKGFFQEIEKTSPQSESILKLKKKKTPMSRKAKIRNIILFCSVFIILTAITILSIISFKLDIHIFF